MEQAMPFWIGFSAIVALTLIIDLGIVNRNPHKAKLRESVIWTCVWISFALMFNAFIFFKMGSTPAVEFLTAYILEYSLSVDNLFVFIMIFAAFGVPEIYQHRVLFWGILFAIVCRVLFIVGGVALVSRFEWILYIFGAFLIFTGIKMAFKHDDSEKHPEDNILVRFASRLFPIEKKITSEKFFFIRNGKLIATPLVLVLIAVETSDIVFAVDSVPAVLSVTTNPLIAVTSNVFAIMGLRSLFFILANAIKAFTYLSYGLAVILTFIGVKLCVAHFVEIPVWLTLSVVISVLTISVLASLCVRRRGKPAKM
jgi:tellurite resistance protein TerC